MDSTNRVERSPTQYDYFAFTKTAVTSLALMVISAGVMKGIQHYVKRTITPFQRNIAGVLLTTVYMVAASRFFGPFTKKIDPPNSSDSKGSSATVNKPQDNPLQGEADVVLRSPIQTEFSGLSASFPSQVDEREAPSSPNLPYTQESKSSVEVTDSQDNLLQDQSGATLTSPIEAELLEPSTSFVSKINERKDSPPHKKTKRRGQISSLVARRLSQNPLDLTRVDPRQIQLALENFRDAISRNGVRFVECTVPLQGRIVSLRVNVSTREKQLEALQKCELLESILFGSQQRELVQSVEEHSFTLKAPDWNAFNTYVQHHCVGMDPILARNKALQGLQLLQKLHRGELVEQENLEEKLSDACWGLMLLAITRGQAFVEGTFDLIDPGYRFFHFFMPILYGRSSSHYKKRVIPITEGYWQGYGHFGYDIPRGGQNELPAYKRTVMLGRIMTRDGTERTYLKMENWGANLNFLSDWRAVTSTHQVAFHSLEFFESQAKRNLPSVFGEVGGGLNMRKEHMLSADKKTCQALYQKITELVELGDRSVDIDEFGFQDVVPLFREVLTFPVIQDSELHGEIASFLEELAGRYDNLDYRKGDEVNLGTSILVVDSAPSRESVDDGFVLV